VVCEGVYTHFSSAKEDKEYTLYQLKLFNECYKKLLSCGIKPKFVHTANSAASVLYPESYFNIIRPGLIIYGLRPFDKVDKYIDIHPILSLKSKIVFLKILPKGKYISYSKTYVTKKKTKVATVPIGYADGLLRKLSNKGKVLIKGKFCNIIGRVTMDMIMVDVNNVEDVKVGDEVVIIGKQLDKQIFVEDIAALCETINYEIATLLSQRIPRMIV
jgi:alanine racemase